MSHKVTELPTWIRGSAETTKQVEDIWNLSCFGYAGERLEHCQPNYVNLCFYLGSSFGSSFE